MRNLYLGSEPWGPGLRMLRASRPKRAKTGARSRLFGASLHQAEELWRAAGAASPKGSPLLYFYGLSQAGRAICAASRRNDWEPRSSHGLRVKFEAPSVDDEFDLDKVRISLQGSGGLVRQVAEPLGSPLIQAEVTLTEVLTSLPEKLLHADQRGYPGVLEASNLLGASAEWGIRVGPLPRSFEAARITVPAVPGNNLEYTKVVSPSSDYVKQWLGAYPQLARLGDCRVGAVETGFGKDDEYFIRLYWDDLGANDEYSAQVRWFRELIDIEQSYDAGLILPILGGSEGALDPIISWWLTLYSLSVLARYHPAAWAQALDVDRSPVAVPLEHILETAKVSVPNLLFKALLEL